MAFRPVRWGAGQGLRSWGGEGGPASVDIGNLLALLSAANEKGVYFAYRLSKSGRLSRSAKRVPPTRPLAPCDG